MHLRPMNCCAVQEIALLQDQGGDSKQAIASICRANMHYLPNGDYVPNLEAFYIFTATARSKYGTKMADYIREHNLGEIVESSYKHNKNSGHKVKVWVWAVDKAGLRAWWKGNRK